MKEILRKIKLWRKENRTMAVRREIDYTTNVTIRGGKLYIVCNGEAVQEFSGNETINEVVIEVSKVIDSRLAYQGIKTYGTH